MTEQKPQRVDGLEAHEVDDGYVVYHTATDRVHYLNASAAVVYELCDGERTETEIEDLVGAAWEMPEPPRAEVQACLAQLRDEGVIV